MRFKVLPLIHKKVWFSGQQYSLRAQLTNFLGHQTPVRPRIYSTVSSATISVFSKPSKRGTWADLYTDSSPNNVAGGLSLRISETLQAMPNLRSLSLYLSFLNLSQEFELYHRMLVAGATEIQYLRIRSSMRVTERFLRTCPALTTLDICHAVELGQLRRIPPSVKRLAVTLYVEPDGCSSIWIPSLRAENIRRIARLNSGLEELILRDSEKNNSPFHSSAIADGGLDALFRDTLCEAAQELSQLPKLKRLAINIWRNASLKVRSDSQPVLLKKKDWYNEWYGDCIRSLGEALPHLQQICIICGYPVYWQGSRQMPDGTLLTKKRTMGSKQRFPGTFERYDSELGLPMDRW
ncbi:unnamed protein product [Clonostachys solani]|uniref:Uncharacterized protein n=1 Tax=Clonostachys solani TaxID=160281 RepID=A0A9N9Z601_9HYPO|nr:unnamed protein product [Clonostachys solani]